MHPPVFNKLEFPLLPLIVLSTSFIILLLSLSAYIPKAVPVSAPVPTPATALVDTTSWKRYQDTKYHYQFNCPAESKPQVEVDNGNGRSIPYKQEICFQDSNQVRILVLDNTPRPTDEYQFQKTLSLPNGKGIVIIQGFDRQYFDSIANTFKFVNDSDYTCPDSEWIDCMPGPGPAKPQCQPDFLNWAKANCPGFQGAAL